MQPFKFLETKGPKWVTVYFYPHQFMVLTNVCDEVIQNRCEHISRLYTNHNNHEDFADAIILDLRYSFNEAEYLTTQYTGKQRL